MKVAIVGLAQSSRHLAPWESPEWELWGLAWDTERYRFHRAFEMHDRADLEKFYGDRLEAYLEKASYCASLVTVESYPFEEVASDVGDYWCSSIAYMLALAIHERAEEIGVYGVDMAACTTGDLRVLTSDLRWVRSDSLRVGDKLLAFDEEADFHSSKKRHRRWRESEVLEASRLTKPCHKLQLEDGREIICTSDHKWLTRAEHNFRWRMAQDLVTPSHRKNRPSRIVKLADVWDEDTTREGGYLAAAFDGEGHLIQNLRNGANGVLRTGFAQRDNEMSAQVLSAMKSRGFSMTQDSEDCGPNGPCKKYTVKGGRMENLRLLGSVRPQRLLSKFRPNDLGLVHSADTVAVVSSEFIGNHPVIGLRTSTKTFVAEGLASHNTDEYGYQKPNCEYLIGLARGRGIKVHIPDVSPLCKFVSPPDRNYAGRYGRT